MNDSTILTINQRGIILSVDRNCCEMFGYSLEELMGHKVDKIIPSPYVEQHDSYIQNYVRTRKARIIGRSRAVQGLHKNGEIFNLRLSVSAVGTGDEMLFVAIINRIGDRAAEVTIDPVGTILTANNNTTEIFGYAHEDLIGHNVKMLMPTEIASKHDVKLSDYQRTRKKSVIGRVRNVAGRRKNGEVFPLSLEVEEIVVTGEDKGQRPIFRGRMEPITAESGHMEATFTLDEQGRVLSCAESYVRTLFGYAKVDVIGKVLSGVLKGVIIESTAAKVSRSEDMIGAVLTGSNVSISADALWTTPGTHVASITHKDDSSFRVQLVVFGYTNRLTGDKNFSAHISRVVDADSMTELEKLPTKTIGDYLVLDTVGHGSYGRVKLARHRTTYHSVAIKVLRKNDMEELEKERTMREVEILKELSHPHIAKCYDVIETETRLNIVLELGSGELFTHVMQSRGLSEFQACLLFRQIASAVEYCHSRGVIHRDIKHKNILLDQHNRIKLIDFGLSNFVEDGKERHTFCGTPAYAAPEMILGKAYKGPEVDVWSCGVVLYSMISGTFPFETVALILKGQFAPLKNVSDACNDLISGMLCSDRDKRLTMKEVRRHVWCSGATVKSATLDTPSVAESEAARVKVVRATVLNTGAQAAPADVASADGESGCIFHVTQGQGENATAVQVSKNPASQAPSGFDEGRGGKAEQGKPQEDAVMEPAPGNENGGCPVVHVAHP